MSHKHTHGLYVHMEYRDEQGSVGVPCVVQMVSLGTSQYSFYILLKTNIYIIMTQITVGTLLRPEDTCGFFFFDFV